MKVSGSIALVTGANRGLGLAFAKTLLEMGAAKVYAGARNPEVVALKGVVPRHRPSPPPSPQAPLQRRGRAPCWRPSRGQLIQKPS